MNSIVLGVGSRGEKVNLGLGDRFTRFVGGLGFVVFDYISSAQWELIFLVIGLWSVTTSVSGHCPFYSMMGIKTCKVDTQVD